MTVSLSLLAGAGWQFFDDNGNPLSGGLLYTYEAGTTTPQTTYTDSNGNVANSNPIVLDAAGRVPYQVWLTSQASYKFILKTSTGMTVWTEDDVPAEVDFATLAASSGSSLIGFLQAGTGAVARTVQSKLRDVVSVKDFGAVGDGTTDDTAAIQDAVNASRSVYIPEPTGSFYRCTAPITLRQDTTLEGANKQNTAVKFFGCSGFIADSAGAGAYDIQIRNLSVLGNDTGTTTDGIRIDGTSANFGRVELDNLVVADFTRNGVYLIRPIVTVLNLVQSSSNGVNGFAIHGDGTSVSAQACYAASNGQDGWYIKDNIQYSSFLSCASDGNTRHGYFFDGTTTLPAEGITLVSCGSESNSGDYFKFGATLGLTLTSCFVFPGSPAAGGHYINLDGCRHVTLSGIRMDATPAAGKYALNIDTLGGTQFPTNIRGIGCSFASINNTNEAYLAFTPNTASAWIAPTLQNGWVNFGSGEAEAGYYKDQLGLVHLRGTIKSGTFSAACFNLPAGYRPASNRNFGTVSNAAFGYVAIASNGNVTPVTGSTTYISLDGMYFLAGA